MFKKLNKILVANRGEIAVRVIRACQELGHKSVAVYSEADRLAPHVRMADEAYLLGPPAATESYLLGSKIIEIAKMSGADGIHPGYGFLAENAAFAQEVIDAGITWIGPSPRAITLMGDKVTARETMANANVPLVPGMGKGDKEELTDDGLIAASKGIGFPLLVKAAAGGGGKGMRSVFSFEELPEAIRSARREAQSAFGDDRVYIEKLIENARHIEVQILGDSHGNIIHLGERECSIQRRHQKLVEEAPSPVVNAELRQKIGDIAILAGKAVDYYSAGTVEFVMDKDKNVYFLEMNTRLQVEHPVTERVTGIDIVKEMLRIASGRRMRYKQSDIQVKGHSIECRILAEDPSNNFMPSIGQVSGMTKPSGPGVRIDDGIDYGLAITPYYDSMIAKVVVLGDTRGEAILRMRRALEEFRISGIKTTIPLHIQLMASPRFHTAQFDTTYLEKIFKFNQVADPEHQKVAAIAATLLAHQRNKRAILLHQGGPSPWRLYGRREVLDRRIR
ncbi:acetyl-CoA carboxylase biotin carboxylase subunit [Anaerolineales bacterium HSG6]|nr:acetyl-CoA carboxylase biotin carboxylase subunit [Anaerolineales bacterium HSG6]MDM8530322.1 acetyl-CoA carboxylase biotin carboxylase subunit [Anaerolineales bacterium HSG25]